MKLVNEYKHFGLFQYTFLLLFVTEDLHLSLLTWQFNLLNFNLLCLQKFAHQVTVSCIFDHHGDCLNEGTCNISCMAIRYVLGHKNNVYHIFGVNFMVLIIKPAHVFVINCMKGVSFCKDCLLVHKLRFH